MSNPGYSDDQLLEALQMREHYGSTNKWAQATGKPRRTLDKRVAAAVEAAQKGRFGRDPIIPGFVMTKHTAFVDEDNNVTREVIQTKPQMEGDPGVPEGHSVTKLSEYIDRQGNRAGFWRQSKPDALDPHQIAEIFAESLKEWKPTRIPKIALPTQLEKGTLATYFLADWHIGLAAKGWGLDEASNILTGTLSEVFSAQVRAEKALVVFGGDFYHIDNWNAETPRSRNPQDAAGTLKEVLNVGRDVAFDVVALALQRHKDVEVLVLPGNHDEVTAHALRGFLDGRFHDEKRVRILDDEHGYYCHRFGKVMQFFHHGHDLKVKDFPGRMAALYPSQWGDTLYRYGHSFHWHHREKLVDEQNGVITEIHQCPSPKDEWGKSKAFISHQAMQSILFHQEEGEWFRVTRPIRNWSK